MLAERRLFAIKIMKRYMFISLFLGCINVVVPFFFKFHVVLGLSFILVGLWNLHGYFIWKEISSELKYLDDKLFNDYFVKFAERVRDRKSYDDLLKEIRVMYERRDNNI